MKNRPTPDDLESIATLVRALTERPRDHASLSTAAAQIAAGRGALLFKALLDGQRDPDTDEARAVVAMMSSLEAMMDVSPGVAGYLMARLYPIARQRYLHNVCDAIGLWMGANPSDELAESLTRLADEGVRPQLQKMYRAWAASARDPRGQTR